MTPLKYINEKMRGGGGLTPLLADGVDEGTAAVPSLLEQMPISLAAGVGIFPKEGANTTQRRNDGSQTECVLVCRTLLVPIPSAGSLFIAPSEQAGLLASGYVESTR